jgi:hypothetical protein
LMSSPNHFASIPHVQHAYVYHVVLISPL